MTHLPFWIWTQGTKNIRTSELEPVHEGQCRHGVLVWGFHWVCIKWKNQRKLSVSCSKACWWVWWSGQSSAGDAKNLPGAGTKSIPWSTSFLYLRLSNVQGEWIFCCREGCSLSYKVFIMLFVMFYPAEIQPNQLQCLQDFYRS